MQRWLSLDDVPVDAGPSVVTIGNFDGVHRGHVKILSEMVEYARTHDLRSVAVTFDPHPRQVLFPEKAVEQITSSAKRLDLIGETGVDAVLVIEFTMGFAELSPEEFISRYLVDALGARRVIVGRDMRFGWHNSGDLATLTREGARHGFEVVAISDVEADPGTESKDRERFSSSLVRRKLSEGDVRGAASALGRRHRVGGRVVHGFKRGRELGFPTANLEPHSDGMVPADGIYAGYLTVVVPGADKTNAAAAQSAGTVLPVTVSIGTNPTFDGTYRTVEAYVLDIERVEDLDLYGDYVSVELIERLRPTIRFDGIDPLVAQMNTDVDATRVTLAGEPPRGLGW